MNLQRYGRLSDNARAGRTEESIIELYRLTLVPLLASAASALAHNAICDCFDNGDETITCEGGFSDGGKAVGVPVRVLDGSGKVLIEGRMGDNSDFKFAKPKVAFSVQFDAGQGHVVTIDGRDIEE
jgi:hypothetical protein